MVLFLFVLRICMVGVCSTCQRGGNMYTLSLYVCVITSLHVGTLRFPRQVPHQSCALVFKHPAIPCRRWFPYRNSLACGASIYGPTRSSCITLTQRERGTFNEQGGLILLGLC